MSLTVGELVAYMDIDDGPWNRSLTAADREFTSFASGVDSSLLGLERDFDRASDDIMAHLERSFAEMDGVVEEAFREAESAASKGGKDIAREVEQAVDKGLDGVKDVARRQGGQAGEEFGDGIGDGGSRRAGGAAAGIAGALKAAPWLAAGAIIGEKLLDGLTSAMANEVSSDLLAAQLDLTAAESAEMGKVAGELWAQAYGENMGEVNAAIGAVRGSIKGMAEASSSDLKGVTANAIDFAKAFEQDVAESAQYAGTLLAVGLARDAEHAFDLMTAASSKVPAALRGDVLEAADEYGQFFKSLGFSGEEAFGLLVQASAKGKYGIDKAGDAIKEFTLLSTDLGSSSVTDAYKAIGLNATDMSNAILAGGDTAQDAFQKIVDGLGKIKDPTEQAAAAVALFGTPLEDLNKTEVPEFLNQMAKVGDGLGDVTGKADKLGDAMADNASTKLEAFKRGMQQKVVDFLGGTVIPAVEDFISKFDMSAIGAEFQETVSKIKDLGGQIIADVRAWAAEHQTEIDKVVQGAKNVAAGVSDAVTAVVEFVRPLWDLFGENILNVAMNTFSNVLDIIGGGLDVLKGIFQVATGILTGDWSKVWEGLENIVQGTVDQVLGIVDLAIGNLVSNLGGDWEKIKSDARATWDNIVGTVERAVQWVMDKAARVGELPGRFADWFGRAKDSAIGKLTELNDWVGGLPSRILGAIGNLGSTLWSAGRDLINGLIQGVKDTAWRIADAVLKPVQDAVRDVKGFLGISSPSKLMAEIGGYMGEGLAIGLEGSSGRVARSLEGLVSGFNAQLNAGLGQPAVSGMGPGQPGGASPASSAFGESQPRSAVHIDNFYTTPNQSPYQISEELNWAIKAGGF